jgi:hypothetical protein
MQTSHLASSFLDVTWEQPCLLSPGGTAEDLIYGYLINPVDVSSQRLGRFLTGLMRRTHEPSPINNPDKTYLPNKML